VSEIVKESGGFLNLPADIFSLLHVYIEYELFIYIYYLFLILTLVLVEKSYDKFFFTPGSAERLPFICLLHFQNRICNKKAKRKRSENVAAAGDAGGAFAHLRGSSSSDQ
jgi:hypothetical protein